MRPPTLAAFALALALSPLPLAADSVTIRPSDDTSLLESSPEFNFNFGAQRDIPIGTTGVGNGSARSRGLFRFDIAADVSPGSAITGAQFQLTVERAPDAATGVTSVYELRRMLVPWVEGDKINNERPGGQLASAGQPTWNHREADPDPMTMLEVPWGAAGGLVGTDFSALSSGAASVLSGDERGDTYLWTLNSKGLADMQEMLDTPATNFGWMLITTSEGIPKTARRFYAKETLTDFPTRVGTPPELIIDFSPAIPLEAPEVTVFSYDGSEIGLEFLASAGITYEIEVSSTLDPASWLAVDTLNPGADGPLSVTIPSSGVDRRFVRVSASDD